MINPILNIDCIEYLKSAPDGTFDLVIADPPYFEICGDFDFMWKNVEEYITWAKIWINECARVLKPTGSMYLYGAIGYNKGFPLFKLVDWVVSEQIFFVRNWITVRNSRGRGMKRGYMPAREELVFFTKSDTYTWNTAYTNERNTRKDLGANGKPRKNEFKRCSDVWIDIVEASQSSIQRFKTNDGVCFPTVKPMDACVRILNASSNEGDLVYIPFGGSGSEAVACSHLRRRFVLTEINGSYIQDIIIPRIANVGNSIDFELTVD